MVLTSNNHHSIHQSFTLHHFMANRWEQWWILFLRTPKSLWMVTAAMKLIDASSLEEKLTNLDCMWKKQRYHLLDKGPYNQSYGFSNGHVWMWELDHKEGGALKNWYFQIVVLKMTLESLLDSKEIKPVNPKENQPRIFIGRIDAEAEAPVLWPPDMKSQLTGKGPEAGKDWGQEEKGETENEMVGWHHWHNGHEI